MSLPEPAKPTMDLLTHDGPPWWHGVLLVVCVAALVALTLVLAFGSRAGG